MVAKFVCVQEDRDKEGFPRIHEKAQAGSISFPISFPLMCVSMKDSSRVSLDEDWFVLTLGEISVDSSNWLQSAYRLTAILFFLDTLSVKKREI